MSMRKSAISITSNKKGLFKIFLLLMLFISLVSCSEELTTEQANQAEPDSTIITDKTDRNPEPDNITEKYEIDYLVLVNNDHLLPDGWEENLQLAYTVNSVGDEVSVERTAYDAYLRMKEALEEEGVHTELDSAFRSAADQQKIIDEFTEKYGADYASTYAAAPGTSEHHTGLALDLYLIVDDVTAYENEDLIKYPEIWEKIHKKLPEYGFILRYPKNNNIGYPYEPWHIRYVGTDAAKEMAERGITLEEYLGADGI